MNSAIDSSSANENISSIRSRIEKLYPAEAAGKLFADIEQVLIEFRNGRETASDSGREPKESWDEQDVILITYGDQIRESNQATLRTLGKFLERYSVPEVINTVHLLPFYPYSSDDGFSVIDYYDLADGMGDWEDVRELNQAVYLMFDLVLNHCSKESEWFRKFLNQEPGFEEFFVVADPDEDLSSVTRPRALPLLTPFKFSDGTTRHIWTTFSDDQVDLNFANPEVLLEFIKVLLFYIQQGARVVRLDAIAFLWKKVGTTCLHLPETHEVVKLMRDVIELVAPEVILLTETNVPHDENVSYFGDGDEAQMVYQFSLPPLLLDAFTHHDAQPLMKWLEDLSPPPAGTTFFNFTASHDGIGVRPLEGLLSDERIQSLVDKMKQRGAFIGMRTRPDGTQSPYELNITYLDAICDPRQPSSQPSEIDLRRFLSTQAVMLSLPGIPGVYFHSLVGTPNDHDAANESGIPRRINRRKYVLSELQKRLDDPSHFSAKVFGGYQSLLRHRTHCSAFHPDGEFRLLELDDTRMIGFERHSPDGQQKVIVIANPTDAVFHFDLASSMENWTIVAGNAQLNEISIDIEAFGFCWLLQTTPPQEE